MDGTLFNDASEITRRTRDAVLAAMGAGVLFVPSTGRPMGGMRQIRATFPGDMPYILFNGAMAMTGETGKVLFSRGLEYACAEAVYAQGARRGYPVIAWAGERLYVSRECEEITIYQRVTGAEVNLSDSALPMRESGVTKIIWIIPPEEAERLQAEIAAQFGDRINCHTSQPHLLEFVDAGASKGLALAAIGAAYGIAREEMVAVGDGWNDLSMLEYAGLGVAMGNAPAGIKALCQYTTLTNDQDGAAAVIEKFILGEESAAWLP